MAYVVEFSPRAERQFRALPEDARSAFQGLLEALRTNPLPRPPVCRKLVSREHTYRLAVGDWRLIFEMHKQELLVLVIWAGPRREAYRRR